MGCLIAHLGIVGGDEEDIQRTISLRDALLDPVQYLEKALDATPNGTWSYFTGGANAQVMIIS